VHQFPEAWGSAAAGTGGGEDLFVVPEAINGIPQAFALLPHAASLFLRGEAPPGGRSRAHGLPGWDPARGRLIVDTPHTQGLAGWFARQHVAFETLEMDVGSPFAVVMVSSLGPEPIARSDRLLVTAVARVEPTGLAWDDPWRKRVASPGRPPLLQEPVRAEITWRRKGAVRAFALDNAGRRAGTVEWKKGAAGPKLVVDGRAAILHWELVAE
jgi:hypothetical protein